MIQGTYAPQGSRTSVQPGGQPYATSANVIKRPKYVEVKVEKPVIVKKYVDVDEEVIVEKPVENIIETEVYIDRIVEVPKEVIIEVEREIVKKEIKEIPIYKEVPVIREIEIPIERIRHVHRDVVIDKEVRVPRYVDRYEDRVKIKPIENQVVYNEITNDIHVYVDKIKEVPVHYDRPVYVDKIVERKVEREFVTERTVPIYVDKVIEQPIHVEFITEVPRPYITEVERAVYVDKVVDRPYEVEKIVNQLNEIDVPVHVERPIYVDKIVENPVEKVVDVPKQIETMVNVYYERNVELPEFHKYDVDIVHARYKDRREVMDREVEKVVWTEEENLVDWDYTTIVPVNVSQTIDLPVERLVEDRRMVDRTVDVELEKEVVVEIVKDEIVERIIEIKRVIERPVFIPKYVERIVDKEVEVRVTVEVPVFREVIRETFTDKPVDIYTKLERLRVHETGTNRPMNTLIRGQILSQAQIRRFNETSRNLARIVEENIKLQAERDHLSEVANIHRSTVNRVTQADVEQLRQQANKMDADLRAKVRETETLRNRLNQEIEVEEIVNYDSSQIGIFQKQIKFIRENNAELRELIRQGGFADETFEVGSEVVGHKITGGIGAAPAFTRTVGPYDPQAVIEYRHSSASRSYSSRSVSPQQRAGSRVITSGQAVYNQKPIRRTSPSPVHYSRAQAEIIHPVRRTEGYATQYSSRSGSRSGSSNSYSGSSRSGSYSPVPARVAGTSYVDRAVGSRVSRYQRNNEEAYREAPVSNLQSQVNSVLGRGTRAAYADAIPNAASTSYGYQRPADNFMANSISSNSFGNKLNSTSSTLAGTLNGKTYGDYSRAQKDYKVL